MESSGSADADGRPTFARVEGRIGTYLDLPLNGSGQVLRLFLPKRGSIKFVVGGGGGAVSTRGRPVSLRNIRASSITREELIALLQMVGQAVMMTADD